MLAAALGVPYTADGGDSRLDMAGVRRTLRFPDYPTVRRACGLAGALAVALLVAVSAVAQVSQPLPPNEAGAVPPPPAESPNPAFRPGFLDAFGRWLGESRAKLDSQMRTTQDRFGGLGGQATGAAKDALGIAQDAASAIAGIPATRIVRGRQRCTVSINGGADCRPAAEALCRSKGFGSGVGLEVNTAQKCPAWVWLKARAPLEGECRTETFVTRAVCQ